MQAADRVEFARILTGLAAIKPGNKLTPEALDVWWLSMQAWSIAEFREAAAHLARSVEFMPSPFHFEGLRKAGRPTAGEAWTEALDRVRHGNYPADDEHLNRVVRAIGGWQALGMTNSDSLHFVERRFADHFEAMQDAGDVRDAVPRIAFNGARLNGPSAVRALLERFNAEPEDA